MNVTCPTCSTVFRVDPAKVPAGGVRARCSVCRGVFAVGAVETVPAPAPAIAALAPPSPPAAVTPPPVMVPPPVAEPLPAAPAVPPAVPSFPAAARRSIAPPTAPPFARLGPPAPSAPGLAMPPRPAAPLRPTRPFAPPVAAPVAPPVVPVMPSAAATIVTTPIAPRPAAPPPMALPPAPGTTTRVINPFLQKDPVTKAQRLARALVSDMVSYHPAKRAQGLKDGTLKDIFREEVKKSYEEYLLQVGEQLAGSTTFFQDALNEILAGGQEIY